MTPLDWAFVALIFAGICGLGVVIGILTVMLGNSVKPAHPQPTKEPIDPTDHNRLLLNKYGRACWDAGYKAGRDNIQNDTGVAKCEAVINNEPCGLLESHYIHHNGNFALMHEFKPNAGWEQHFKRSRR